MNYYNPETDKAMTDVSLSRLGYSLAPEALAEHGYYPVHCDYPEHDILSERMVADTELVDERETAGRFVQKYHLENLPPDVLAANVALLADLKAREAREKADAAVAPYMAEFSELEKQTWGKQQAEVEAWLADNKAQTPTLDALAQARGIERASMLEKAARKVSAFGPLSLAIVGKQQAYEDAIKAVASDDTKTLKERIAALRSMEFVYELPE